MIKNLQLFILVILMLSVDQGICQEWLVPTDQATIENPLDYNLDNVKKGKELYIQNCKSCHGDAGKNNALPLVPPPPDVTSETMQNNTEGGLFHKITVGKGGMPQFETTISEDDRWRLVNYIMNYNPGREALLIDAPPVEAKLMASVAERERLVEIFAESLTKEGEFQKLADAEITISARKAFGNIAIGKIKTNKDGRAEFHLPETLIGDENGLVSIVVTIEESFAADQVILDEAKVGLAKEVPKLIQGEILWSTNENIQSWLLLSYIGAAGGAWLAIAYVIFLIFKIRRYSKE